MQKLRLNELRGLVWDKKGKKVCWWLLKKKLNTDSFSLPPRPSSKTVWSPERESLQEASGEGCVRPIMTPACPVPVCPPPAWSTATLTSSTLIRNSTRSKADALSLQEVRPVCFQPCCQVRKACRGGFWRSLKNNPKSGSESEGKSATSEEQRPPPWSPATLGHQYHPEASVQDSREEMKPQKRERTNTRHLRDSDSLQHCWVLPTYPGPPGKWQSCLWLRGCSRDQEWGQVQQCELGVDIRSKSPTYGKLELIWPCPKQTHKPCKDEIPLWKMMKNYSIPFSPLIDGTVT